MTLAQTLLGLAGIALIGGVACFQVGDRLMRRYRYSRAYLWLSAGAFLTGVMGTAVVAAVLVVVT